MQEVPAGRGPRQLTWEFCLTSAGREVTIEGGNVKNERERPWGNAPRFI